MFDMTQARLEIARMQAQADAGKLVEWHGRLVTRDEIANARKIEGGHVL